ncbi:hydrolase [Sphaerisporangium siamense]|uniref:Putative amidohydrolase n=1 Tax=Sphaerisporangium siamense TaxID=795645 RepID=A0A7W7DBC6_9ACTN|nr:nitrilase family protein [Sphaerisporangium siamense]MBB4703708.1 putative amidohydrolase [Sphaerisporangium siamense]GII82180.1 hydrolase [Sphaerisporangium siamense]
MSATDPSSSRILAASVQFCHRSGDKAYNLATIARFVAEAAARGVRLIVFPEMCVTGYWHVVGMDRAGIQALAEPVPGGPSVTALLELARRHDMVVGAGLVEADGEKLYNSYVVAEPDGSWHVHRKLHSFESEHISSGDRYTVFASTLGCTLGVLTCYDNNIIENARMTALLGADILLAPHQTGGVASRSPHAMGTIDVALWEARDTDPRAIEAEFRGDKGRGWLMRWLPARAHDNGMFLVFSNGVGPDNGEVRTGNAMLIDCYGRIVAETWRARDEMVCGELDLSLLARSTGRRWLRGRRPELYRALAEPTGREVGPIEARFSPEPA